MSAPAGWQKGSFRGVPFRTENQEESGGRRGVVHEFPQGEKPVWEDLGRAGASFRIECHVLGEDFLGQANALADALNQKGAGTLIHPWRGSMQVAVPEFSRTDNAGDDGGISRFSITFVEPGLPAMPQPETDTQAVAVAAADDAADAAPGLFAGGFSVAKATAFVESAAGYLVSGAAALTALRGGMLGGAGPVLRAFQAGLDLLGGAGVLIRAPLELGLSIVGLVQTLSVIGGSHGARADALYALAEWGETLPPVIGDTPARNLERDNQAAIVQLVNLAASAELVRCLAGTSFPSYDDAVAARDRAADRLDSLALRQADAGDDDGAAQYDALRRAMTADLTARGGSLARIESFTPATTEPALVIAQRLYGDPATVIARADEIVARNKVVHPGFVPGGAPLQVLSGEARDV